MTSPSYREDAAHYPRLDRSLIRDLEKMDLNANFRPHAAPVAHLWNEEDATQITADAQQRFRELSQRMASVGILSDASIFRIEPSTSVTAERNPLWMQQCGRSLRSPEWHKRQCMYNLRRRLAIVMAAAGGFAMGAALFYAATA